MKKTIRLILILLLIILLIGSCNFSTNKNKFGYIIISTKFPQNNFKIKTIPLNTNKIVLELSGEWLTESLKFTLTPKKPEMTILTFSGNKNLSATTFDINNNMLAYGKNSVYVYPNVHNKVEIVLIEGATPDNPEGTATPSITQSSEPVPTITPTIGGGISSSNPVTSAEPTEKPIPTITPSTSPSNNGYSGTNTYIPEINTNVNIIVSTPLPSGITAGFYKMKNK